MFSISHSCIWMSRQTVSYSFHVSFVTLCCIRSIRPRIAWLINDLMSYRYMINHVKNDSTRDAKWAILLVKQRYTCAMHVVRLLIASIPTIRVKEHLSLSYDLDLHSQGMVLASYKESSVTFCFMSKFMNTLSYQVGTFFVHIYVQYYLYNVWSYRHMGLKMHNLFSITNTKIRSYPNCVRWTQVPKVALKTYYNFLLV